MSGKGKAGAPEKLIVHGKRLDGRGFEEFRPIGVEVGTIGRANGSAMFRFGETWSLTGVYGPREMHPKGLQDPTKAILRTKYFMAPFSTWERSKPGTNRRSTEISKVLKEALMSVLLLEDFPKTAIDVFMEILQADASTRIAALNAASLALADAGIPMKDMISSVSVGKIDGQIVLDIGGIEDNFGDVDTAVATIADSDRFVLIQMDGIVTRKEFEQLLHLARKGTAEVYKRQKAALMEKYAGAHGSHGNEEGF